MAEAYATLVGWLPDGNSLRATLRTSRSAVEETLWLEGVLARAAVAAPIAAAAAPVVAPVAATAAPVVAAVVPTAAPIAANATADMHTHKARMDEAGIAGAARVRPVHTGTHMDDPNAPPLLAREDMDIWACHRVAAGENQCSRMAHPIPGRSQQDDILYDVPGDALAFTHKDPGNPAFHVPLPRRSVHMHIVVAPRHSDRPARFREGAHDYAIVRVRCGDDVLQACAELLAMCDRHAECVGHSEGVRRQLYAGNVAVLAHACCSRWHLGGLECLPVRVEGYMRPDGADGASHQAHSDELDGPLFPLGCLYVQTYSGGRGFGLCVRVGTCWDLGMPPRGQLLIRAVRIDGRVIGMTAFARLCAAVLGCSEALRWGARFHIPTSVLDLAVHGPVYVVFA